MVLQLTDEQEAQLSRIAAEAGKAVEDLAREAVDRFLTEEAHFRSAVLAGQQAAERGDFVPTPEVWAKVERVLGG
ncbi:MAG: hypothetical protein ACRD3N_07990 [Terracidiphilus sp.]